MFERIVICFWENENSSTLRGNEIYMKVYNSNRTDLSDAF